MVELNKEPTRSVSYNRKNIHLMYSVFISSIQNNLQSYL